MYSAGGGVRWAGFSKRREKKRSRIFFFWKLTKNNLKQTWIEYFGDWGERWGDSHRCLGCALSQIHTHPHTPLLHSFWVRSCVGVEAGISPHGFHPEVWLTARHILCVFPFFFSFFFRIENTSSCLRRRRKPLFPGKDTPSNRGARTRWCHFRSSQPVSTGRKPSWNLRKGWQ